MKIDGRIKTENVKGQFVFRGEDGKNWRLTDKEKKFCDNFLDFRGNGAQAAFKVYGCKNIRIAAALAYESLKKPHIIAYVNSQLVEAGLCDNNVEKQHLFTLNQFADMAAKNKAIDMFYRLRGKYAPEKFEDATPYAELSNAELLAKERELMNALSKHIVRKKKK